MKIEKLVLLAFVISMGVSGCVTVPKDIGDGRFQKVYTDEKGWLITQIDYKSSLDCQFFSREMWGNLARDNQTSKCSSTDDSGNLPYKIKLTADSALPYGAVHFAESHSCRRMENSVRDAFKVASKNVDITSNCDVPSRNMPTQSKTAATVEERLRELKRLTDAGLVTNEVYLDRQRKILDGGN